MCETKTTREFQFSYEAHKKALVSGFAQTFANAGVNDSVKYHSVLSEVGKGVILAGGVLTLCGIVMGSSQKSLGAGGLDLSSPFSTPVSFAYSGLCIVVVGAILTIAGSVYDRTAGGKKYTFIAPKSNEVGVAYNF